MPPAEAASTLIKLSHKGIIDCRKTSWKLQYIAISLLCNKIHKVSENINNVFKGNTFSILFAKILNVLVHNTVSPISPLI